MATLYFPFSLMKSFLLSSSLLFILILCFLKKSNALEDAANESHYHTVEIISLFPASVCSPSTTIKGSNKRQSTLEVLHQHGPCSQPNPTTPPPPLTQILSHDQTRVKSIQTRINPNPKKNPNNNSLTDNKAATTLPVASGRSLGSGNYIVTVGLGTPQKTLTLMLDTGSDLTWTQCQPCIKSCYQQQDPIFNPSTSTSYSNISCTSPQCFQLITATGIRPACTSSTMACIYGIKYGDQSFSVGIFSTDKLTLSEPDDTLANFAFGCGQNNQGLFGRTAGVLGLGRNPLSIISQTAQKYGKYFSYCLPSTSSSTGHLTLGRSGTSSNVKFTPFSTRSQSFYFIDIISISVGGYQLQISPYVFKIAGSIIDSGTVITRLPPAAYNAMSSKFSKLMGKYPSAPAFSILDTCFDLSNYTTVIIPTISFVFSGNVVVDLPAYGILLGASPSQVCLAFAGNEDAGKVAIFGNTQQKTMEVVYDVGGGKLGFGADGC